MCRKEDAYLCNILCCMKARSHSVEVECMQGELRYSSLPYAGYNLLRDLIFKESNSIYIYIHMCLKHAITCVYVNDWRQCHHGVWRILAPAGRADISVLPQGCLTVQKIKAGKIIKTHLPCVATECSNLDMELTSDLLLQTVRQHAKTD